jgi:hypothetical protein
MLILGMAPGVIIRAHAHGGAETIPAPAPGEAWELRPPLEDAATFAELLDTEARGLLNAHQVDLLATARHHFSIIERFQHFPRLFDDPTLADYNRQKGDDALLQLLDSLQPSRLLDCREGYSFPDPDEIVPFNVVTQALLLKIIVSDGPVHTRSQIFPMEIERYIAPYDLRVAPTGTTWVMLRLREVPLARSTTGLRLIKDGEQEPFAWHALTLEPETPGHLRLAIMDEHGDSSPAFVSLRHVETGRLWPIADAHDFNSIVHNVTGPPSQMLWWLPIHGPQGSVKVPVPGPLAGYYWLISPPVEVTLPPGEWEVTALRGIEHEPQRLRVQINAGRWQETVVQAPRWIDMAARGWISGDDHVHGRLMNSADAHTLLALSHAMDIRVANILEMGDAQRTYYTQRGFGPDFRVRQGETWLIPGQEDPRSLLGHNIGLNLTGLARDLDHYLALDWVSREVRAQGGLFGQTHVGQNACFAHRGMAIGVVSDLYDFVSLMQGGLGTDLYYDFLNLGYKLTATAGSDMPYAAVLGDVRVYALVEDPDAMPDAWFEALRAGRTFVTNGPLIDFTVNGLPPGSEIEANRGTPLVARAQASGLVGHSAPVLLEIIALGEVIASQVPDDAPIGELVVEATLPPGEALWVAARVTGANGSAAHTTPVYVTRPGQRHWNRAQAPGIIDRQLAVLDEIEKAVSDVEQTQRDGTLNRLDFERVRIAQQAAPLRETIARSRNRYEALRAEAVTLTPDS